MLAKAIIKYAQELSDFNIIGSTMRQRHTFRANGIKPPHGSTCPTGIIHQ